MFSTEHGPSLFDGPAGRHEINVIVKVGNYGWPLVSHENTLDGTIHPITTYTPAIAPSDIVFDTRSKIPKLQNLLVFAGHGGEGLF